MATPTAAILPPELLERVKRLAFQAEALARGDRAGAHPSRRLGGGSEFTEYKGYERGDDLRFLDWRVQARTGRDVVRRFQSDRARDVWIVLDGSGSMAFGTTDGRDATPWGPWPASKWEAARTLALALAFLSVRQGDRVGLSFVEHGGGGLAARLLGERRVPLRGGLRQIEELAVRVAGQSPRGGGDLAAAVADAAGRERAADLVLVTDLLGDRAEEALDALAVHAARGRSVAVLHVVDPAEIDFPFDEPTLFLDLEDGATLPANPREVGAAYRAEFAAFLSACRVGCARRGIRHALVRTGEPLEEALGAFLQSVGSGRGR